MGRFTYNDDDNDAHPENNETGRLVPFEVSNDYHDQIVLPYHERETNRSRLSFSRLITIVAIAIFLQKYMPPPPPPTDSWSEFFSKSTEGVVEAFNQFILLSCYVFTGSIRNFYSDVQTSVLGNLSDSEMSIKPSSCTLSIPDDLFEIESYLRRHMIAQGDALGELSTAIHSWSKSKRNNGSRSPLSLLLVGPEGVGKSRASKLLASLLLKDCHNYDPGYVWNDISSDGYIELDGVKFGSDSKADDCEYKVGLHSPDCMPDIINRVLDFLRKRRGKGAVILFKHADKFSPNEMKSLMNLLSHFDSQTKHDEELSDNVIFIITAETGTDLIFEHTTKTFYDKNMLKMKLKTMFQELFQYSSGQGFQLIAPFWPLQYSEIMDVLSDKLLTYNLKHKGTRWSNLEISNRLMRHLTDPNFIEYIVLKPSSEEDDKSVIFAKRGGHAVDINIIIKIIDRQLLNSDMSQHTLQLDYSDSEQQIYMNMCFENRNECTLLFKNKSNTL